MHLCRRHAINRHAVGHAFSSGVPEGNKNLFKVIGSQLVSATVLSLPNCPLSRSGHDYLPSVL